MLNPQEQKIDYTKYVPDVEFDDKVLGPAAKEIQNIQIQIENLVNDLTDLIQRNMFNLAGEQKPLEDIPLKRLAQKGILPDHLGETTGKELVKIELYMDPKEKGYLTALAGLLRHKSLEDFLSSELLHELKDRYFSSNGRRAAELDYSIDCWGIKTE
jgi:hypothetical protein